MKKLHILAFITSSSVMFGQPVGSPPTPLPAFTAPEVRNAANSAWYRGGNTGINGPNNIFGTAAGFNSSIWHQTNGFNRMLMMNGTGADARGRVAFGNALPSNFLPQGRLHLHQTGGSNPVNMYFTTNTTGSNFSDGLEIGISFDGDAFFTNHEFNKNFSWFNQGASNALLARMRLYDGGLGQDKGRLAISDNLPAGFNPQARLHMFQMLGTTANGNMLRSDGLNSVNNIWEMQTGNTANSLTQKFSLTIPANTSNAVYNTSNNGLQLFETNSAQRMILFNDEWNTAGSAGSGGSSTPFGGGVALNLDPASPVIRPAALLTIANGNPNFLGGWRNWMQVGTFNYEGFNQLYVGMKTEQLSAADAVINWGDNSAAYGAIRNYMRFIFTAPSGDPGFAGNPDGLEVMRMNTLGKIGIGNYFNNLVEAPFINDPARRLEILSDKTTAGANGNPLLRLTHTQQDPASLNITGKYSEFQPLATGDLFINMRDNTITSTINPNLKERYLGINTNTPGNTVEINSQFQSHLAVNGTGGTGWAGLRFTDLTSKSTVVPNNNIAVDSTKVLTVDSLGNVVLIKASGSGSSSGDNGLSTSGPTAGKLHLGQSVGAANDPGRLLDDREVPLNKFSLYFNKGDGGIGIGNIFPSAPTLLHKLFVNNDLHLIGSRFETDLGTNGSASIAPNQDYIAGQFRSFTKNADNNIGIFTMADSANISNIGIRSFGVGKNLPGSVAFGVQSIAGYAAANIGAGNSGVGGSVSIISIGSINNAQGSSLFNYGVEAFGGFGSSPTSISAGIRAYSTGANSQINYGVLASAQDATTNYGIYASAPSSGGTSGPNYAGYFNGDLVYTGSFGMASDATLKTNIDTLQDAISIIKQLKPKQFNFNQTSHPSMSFPNGLQYGLIAQDVELILPNLVNNNVHPAKLDSLGNILVPQVNFKSVEYEQLIPFLIKGMQQQQAQIKKQDSLITLLTSKINDCCSQASINNNTNNQNQKAINAIDIELSDRDAIVLSQNVPNPFAEQTTITYNVPASVGKAQILFFNNLGQMIQTVDIKTRGKGKVNVFASDLSAGLYNYTLVADGKIIDSKKMVRE